MHIGVDARELSGHPTGVGRYLQRLLEEWAQVPVRHCFTLYSPDARAAVPPGLDAVIALERGDGGTRWEQITLARAVRRDRPDVFFAPGYTAPLQIATPLVVAVHDVSFAAHPEWFRWREGIRRRLVARLAARRARHVLTISAFSRDEIVRYLRVPAGRVRVVPLGVGLGLDRSTAATARDPLVLFVGSIFNRRHVPVLIDAFASLARERPDLRLEIVGDNRTWPPEDLAAHVRAAGVQTQVRLRDWVSDEELRALYARASAFAFLSSYEGFGLTPLEALAAGVPPVVLDTPVAREVLGPAAVRVAHPEVAQVAAALVAALDDGPPRRAVLAAAADVLGRYRWADTAAATLTVLEQAARP
jgi:glycosyltransferase involved in cell wall biosynthesis